MAVSLLLFRAGQQ